MPAGATTAARACSAGRDRSFHNKALGINSHILFCVPALLAIAGLVGLYLRTFGLSRAAPTAPAIDGTADASGRTLRQRLDGSEASFREG